MRSPRQKWNPEISCQVKNNPQILRFAYGGWKKGKVEIQGCLLLSLFWKVVPILQTVKISPCHQKKQLERFAMKKPQKKLTWMSQEVSKRLGSVGYSSPNIHHLEVGYNPFTNHLLSFWDILVPAEFTLEN